jgi:hypothetical protein
MTGYESKKAAAQAKTIDEVNWADHEPNGLAQPAQEPASVTYKEVADTMNMLWRGKPKQVAIAIEMENMRLYTAPPQPAPVDIASLVEGMEVSIDVSTGEHDYGNRLFGTVTLVQESQYGKHGLILLVQNPEANFETPQPAQKPVAWLYEGEYSSGSYSGNYFAWNVTMNKNATNAARKVKPLYTKPPHPSWVGLTHEQAKALVNKYGRDPLNLVFQTEAKLKEKNS